ncbi:hypothetical protein BDR22DRAFT_895447 [Usnea florida]
MSLSPRIQGGHEACRDVQKLEDVPATDRDGSLKTPSNSRLQKIVKKQYLGAIEGLFALDLKQNWSSARRMFKLATPTPPPDRRWALDQLCNKSTMLYWEVSAQHPDPDYTPCPGDLLFACIYKRWFRCHNNDPDIGHGKFFAHPFQITPNGPRTIPETLQAHAHICGQATSNFHFHLLPLCRAIIVLLDEPFSWPEDEEDGTISLDKEAQRRTVVLVLTGHDQDLSFALNFDSIRSEALPLARKDVSAADSENMIRVSLKTAVHFIAESQRKQERESALLSSEGDSADTALDAKPESVFTTNKSGDEYVEYVFDNPSKSEKKWRAIDSAAWWLAAEKNGEMNFPHREFQHWKAKWV